MDSFQELMDKYAFIQNTKELKKPLKILFICSGNIIRSAYAEFVFRKMVEDSDILRGKIQVKSGAVQFKNTKIDERTVSVLESEGFNPEEVRKHIPKHKDDYPEIFDEADIIIGMTKSHRVSLPKQYRAGEFMKFTLLSELANDERKDIEDPYFTNTMDEYRQILKEVNGYLRKLIQKLVDFYK
jgi:protein-tyrosine-phosphatase